MISPVVINNFVIGTDNPCFIIAEAGVNHNGDLDIARQLIDAAKESGADAVKFQYFITENLVTDAALKATYQVENTGVAGSQFEMLKSLELDFEQHEVLKKYCEERGILYICTPYDHHSVNKLDELDVAVYKIASTDTTNIPLLRHIAGKGRPVILSTGMCTLGEVEVAVSTLKENGLEGKIILLQCTSEYPAPMAEINLKAMQTLEQAFLCPVGFSDHTEGVGASPWSVALGARIVEKHFTLDCSMDGPDHRASIEPAEFETLVRAIRDLEQALGDGMKRITAREVKNKEVMQKSLVADCPIPAGTVITEKMVTCKRPGTGLPPLWFDRIVGKKTIRSISAETLIQAHDINWETL